MKRKSALIFGVTGQDGSYLTELLLRKNYIVHGVKRRTSDSNKSNNDNFYQVENKKNRDFIFHYGDISDFSSVSKIIEKTKPDEIYNLAAQSNVTFSFEVPEYTANANALGALRIVESIKLHKLIKKTKFYQAGSSEMFGKVHESPQNENTPFYPLSPYAVAKLYAHWITKNYRETYGIFGCNGILFNHESPRRGTAFVTKKIISGLCKIKEKKKGKLLLGNLNSKRDWGHAKDYCFAMWKILQQKKPDDFVIATGIQYSIEQFINKVAKKLNMKIYWKGKGIKQKGYDKNGNIIIECHKNYFRPLDVNKLLGNSKKARKILKWKPKYDINSLIEEMISYELSILNNDQ